MKIYSSIFDGVQRVTNEFVPTTEEEVSKLLYDYVVNKGYDIRTPMGGNSSSWHEIWLTKGSNGTTLVIDFEEPEEEDE